MRRTRRRVLITEDLLDTSTSAELRRVEEMEREGLGGVVVPE